MNEFSVKPTGCCFGGKAEISQVVHAYNTLRKEV